MPSKRQRQLHKRYVELGCDEEALAEEEGITIINVRKTLFLAAKAGLPVAPAFSEHLPSGVGLKATSTLVNRDGETVLTWYKGSGIEENQEEIFKYLESRVPINKVEFPDVLGHDEDLQLEITMADLHYGMLAWGQETNGGDYDMKIARSLVACTMEVIYQRAGTVGETVLVLMGDNFHTDFFNKHTEKSKHSLDVDSRYPKMVLTGAETFISAIEYCKVFSKKVKVIVMYGNHDTQTSVNLQVLLYYYFRDRADNIEIDISPAKCRYNVWGVSATEYAHGDGTNAKRLTSEVQRYVAHNDITGVREFYAKQAHLHKEHREDVNGVMFEIVPSPTATDAFGAGHNYYSRRAVVATSYHKKYGELARYTITPRSLEAMKDHFRR